MGCSGCGSNNIANMRKVIDSIRIKKVDTGNQTPDSTRKRTPRERSNHAQRRDLCPLCGNVYVSKLENYRDQWIRVNWCAHCQVKSNV